MPETVYIYDPAIASELWNIKMELYNQLERVSAQNGTMIEAMTETQAVITENMVAPYEYGFGFGVLLGLLVATIWAVSWKI